MRVRIPCFPPTEVEVKMHPAMQALYKWMFWFYDDGVFIADPNWIFNPEEVLILNEHGTMYMPRGEKRLLKRMEKSGKYISLAQRMKE